MSQLVKNGVPLREIAGLDDFQMAWVYFRPRNKYGELLRPRQKKKKGHVGKPVHFQDMFKALWTKRGMTQEEIDIRWQRYKENNPSLSRWLRRTGRRD